MTSCSAAPHSLLLICQPKSGCLPLHIHLDVLNTRLMSDACPCRQLPQIHHGARLTVALGSYISPPWCLLCCTIWRALQRLLVHASVQARNLQVDGAALTKSGQPLPVQRGEV